MQDIGELPFQASVMIASRYLDHGISLERSIDAGSLQPSPRYSGDGGSLERSRDAGSLQPSAGSGADVVPSTAADVDLEGAESALDSAAQSVAQF